MEKKSIALKIAGIVGMVVGAVALYKSGNEDGYDEAVGLIDTTDSVVVDVVSDEEDEL